MNDLAREACAWVPTKDHLRMMRVLTNLHLYIDDNGEGSPRRPGDPYIHGYRVLDDGGGTGCFQVRVEGLNVVQMRRIVGPGISVTMEHV